MGRIRARHVAIAAHLVRLVEMCMIRPFSFVPGKENARAYRDVLGTFPTGVTVVTVQTDAGPVGMTANSFSSISLDPPLVLWSPSKFSKRFDAFASAKRFAIHVLRHDQKPLAMEFAKRGDAFDQVDWRPNFDGVPVFDDCLSILDCETHDLHDGGDHVIVVARVLNATLHAGTPLVFAQGAYGQHLPEDG